MSKFKHRGEDIQMDEAPSFKEDTFTVNGNGKVVYKAGSKFGKAFSTKPADALDEAKRTIDKNLDKEK